MVVIAHFSILTANRLIRFQRGQISSVKEMQNFVFSVSLRQNVAPNVMAAVITWEPGRISDFLAISGCTASEPLRGVASNVSYVV